MNRRDFLFGATAVTALALNRSLAAEKQVKATASRPQRITLAQVTVTRNVAANLARARAVFQQARREGAGWILFPEGFLSGYYAGFKQAEVAAAFDEMRQLCREGRITGLIGTCWTEDGKTYNQLRVVDTRGVLAGAYSKICLTYGDAKEFIAGSAPGIIDVEGLRAGLLICNDLWVTPGYTDGPNPHLSQTLAKAGADVIFHAVNSGTNENFRGYHEENLKVRAAEARRPIVVVNAASNRPINCTSGVVQDFRYIAELPREGEQIQTIVVNV